MNKKQFITLANHIRGSNANTMQSLGIFTPDQIEALADFCRAQNPAFNRARWLSYIAGTCGPNGGKIKP